MTAAPPLPPAPDNEMLLIRTDYTDEDTWRSFLAAVRADPGEFSEFPPANPQIVEHPDYSGLTTEQVVTLLRASEFSVAVFIADTEALSGPDYPVLVVALEDPEWADEPYTSIRIVARLACEIESNVVTGNLEISDYADLADDDGVIRAIDDE